MKNLIVGPVLALSMAGCGLVGGVKTPSGDTGDTGRDMTRPDGGSGDTAGGGNPGGDGGGTPGGSGDTSGETGETGGPVSDLECDGQDSSPPAGPDCITGTIHCGETIEATTQGGTQILDQDFYESAYCFIPYQDYAGPERVYALEVDGGGDPMLITTTLESPCEDLSLAMFYWSDTNECPHGTKHNVANCDGSGVSGGFTTTTYTTGETPDRYLISVDGDTAAAFRLSVICEQ